jgi:hypothetical protein
MKTGLRDDRRALSNLPLQRMIAAGLRSVANWFSDGASFARAFSGPWYARRQPGGAHR